MKIFECTLRDGTYILDFMIEPSVFCDFSSKMIELGFSDIEVGHGLGLGAYRKYSAGFTDKTLWESLSSLTSGGNFFSFFIPYIGNLDDVRMAKDNGMSGVRFGVEPVYLKEYRKTLEDIKNTGISVFLNIMKSYTITPQGFAEIVKDYKDLVDVVYIVDSAGHMLPSELKEYVYRINDKVGMTPLGFHGHNNLGLATASALELIDLGVDYIDTTLTGIGRSGGNVATEVMLAIMAKKLGTSFDSDKRLLNVLKLAYAFKEYVTSKGKLLDIRSEDILFGYAGFHSSFEKTLRNFADETGRDFLELVLLVSRVEKTKITDSLLNNLFS